MHKNFFSRDFELTVFEGIYFPLEDSILLAESLQIPNGSAVLDLGTGSGLQGIVAALQGASFVCFADKNPLALKNAKTNFEKIKKKFKLKAKAEFVGTDLFSKIKGKFGVIVFNPPYVPSSEKRFLDLDGGALGREILGQFLSAFPKFLNKNGKIVFLQTNINGIQKTKKILGEEGFEFRIIARKKLFFEELLVFEAKRKVSEKD